MRTETDIEILNQIINKETGKVISAKTSAAWFKKRGYYDYLLNRYNDNTTDSLTEIVHRLINDIEHVPTCRCGNVIQFTIGTRRYPGWCSRHCQNTDSEVLKKNAESVSKYRKWEYAHKKDEVMAKKAATLKARYGEDSNGSPFCCKAVQDKVKETFKENYGTPYYTPTKEQTEKSIISHKNLYKRIWKERGLDIEYLDDGNVLVRNGCKIHGDIILSGREFNNRSKEERRNVSTMCTICNPLNIYSGKELAVKEHLDSIGVSYVEHNKTLIKPLELDFYIESANIAIEVDGVYYHNENNKPKDYHINKTNLCQQKDIRLLHVWEHFLDFRRELVFRLIDKALNKTRNFIIRKPVIKEIFNTRANEFHKENNLYGGVKCYRSFGLYSNDILLSVLSIDVDPDNYIITIKRFTDSSYWNVIHSLHYFVEYLKELYIRYSIIINVCRDFENLDLYTTEGFVQIDFKNTSRNMYANTAVTEEKIENLQLEVPRIKQGDLRYYRCYDSGTITYKLTFNP